jgi:hypothetical protein
MLDNYIAGSLIKFDLTDEWVRSFMSSKHMSLFLISHPEIIFLQNQIKSNYFFDSLADICVVGTQCIDSQSLLVPVMLLPQLLFVLYACILCSSLFFSFYASSSKEGLCNDSDFLSIATAVESEKEIGSVDDILIPVLLFMYMLGWYFYIHC